MTLMIDPPEGWKYGFPKPFTIRKDQEFGDWLEVQGYPEDLIHLAEKYSRYWEKKDECICSTSWN